jgi:hypothetical protein
MENISTKGEVTIHPMEMDVHFEPLAFEEEACATVVDAGDKPQAIPVEEIAVPKGMEKAPPRSNPPTSVTPADIRARVMATANVPAEAAQKLADAIADKYPQGFAEKVEELTQTTLISHRIDTDEKRPVQVPQRRLAPAMLDLQRKEADTYRAKGLTRPSCSPWNAPVVMAPKKDGKLRFCIDYRALNEVTTKDWYPMARTDDAADRLQGAVVFTTVDLASGYWQVPIREQDRFKTAFSVAGSHDEWNVMPFGLCNAPATFQRLMDLVLGGLKWTRVLVYIDDIIIYSRSPLVQVMVHTSA